MNRYAFSYLVNRDLDVLTYQMVGVGFLLAISRDKAVDKALRIVTKLYPKKEHWDDHRVACLIDTTPNTEPETLLEEGRSS